MQTHSILRALFALLLFAVIAYSFSAHYTAAQYSNSTNSYNTSNSSINSTNSTIVAVNITNELNNSANAGYNFTSNAFTSNSTTSCSLALISNCDNNLPSQFVCINVSNEQSYMAQHQNLSQTGSACPDFMLVGYLYCGVQNGSCVVEKSSQLPFHTINSTNSTTNSSNMTNTTGPTPTICSLPNIPYGCSWVSTANATAPCAGHVSCTNSTTVLTSTGSTSNIITEIIQFFQNLFKGL